MRTNLPRAVRALRRERGWRQTDLAACGGLSRHVVSRLERGRLKNLPIGAVVAIASALDATLDMTLRWRGEGLDRLLDAAHAAVQDQAATMFRGAAWTVDVEVSFNHYGDRGRIDLLAFHAASGFLVVGEVKSAIGDVQETLGRLDIKTRIGPLLARQAGRSPIRPVVPALVILEGRTARRMVAAHPALFARFACRGRAANRWLRKPTAPAPSGLLWFVRVPNAYGLHAKPGTRVRNRHIGP